MEFRKILIIFPIFMLSISFSGCIIDDIDIGDSDQNDIQDNHGPSGNFSNNFTISCEGENLFNSEYDNIYLINTDNKSDTINLLKMNTVNHSFEPFIYHSFKIVCGVRPVTRHVTNGWNAISVPFNQTISKNNISLFSDNTFYDWTDAVTLGLVNDFIFGLVRPGQYYTFSDVLNPGEGYWLYSYADCELWIENVTVTPDDYITNIEENWNIVSVPHNENVNKTDILVNDVNWSTAVTNGWISDFVFGWNRQGQYYDFCDTFMPGYAYWMYAYQQCTLKRVI